MYIHQEKTGSTDPNQNIIYQKLLQAQVRNIIGFFFDRSFRMGKTFHYLLPIRQSHLESLLLLLCHF